MKAILQLFLAFAILGPAPWMARAEPLVLDYERLRPAMETLTSADRDVVADAISLIQRGEHTLALSRLSSLKQRSPQNSSLRILASYALLQMGHLAGAFEEAERAHKAPDGDVYKCWFLAKIALLHGKRDVCEREIQHVEAHAGMLAEAEALRKELESN